MDVIPPVFNILYDDLVRGMYRECPGDSLGEGVGDAPCVFHVLLPRLQQRACEHERVEQKLYRFVLIHEPVGISSPDHLEHVLFWC